MYSRNNTFQKKKFFLVGDMVQVVNKRHKMSGKFGLVARLSNNNTHDGGVLIIVKIGKLIHQMHPHDIKFCTRIKRYVDKKNNRSNQCKLYREDQVANHDYGYKSYQSQIRELVDLVDDADSSDSDDNFGNR